MFKCFVTNVLIIRLQVPKNAVKKKCLLRISLLGISETPHKTDRIFNRSIQGENSTSVMMAITPAINVSPVDVEFLKPITIQLPTCIAIHNDGANPETQELPKDIDNHGAVNVSSSCDREYLIEHFK